MTDQRILPEKVTKPIQLLAAWLTGLVLVDVGFLTAASNIKEPSWAAGVLVVAAVVNVPMFLAALFLLQTRFPPEMQEDTFYSKYLERKYSTPSGLTEPLDVHAYAKELTENIIKEIGPSVSARREPIEKVIQDSQVQELVRRKGNSRALSELFLRPEHWPARIEHWEYQQAFDEDLHSLIAAGLITVKMENPRRAQLTELGRQVAEIAREEGVLWSQTNTGYWDEEANVLRGSTSAA